MSETIGTEYIQIEPSMKGIGSKINSEFSGAGESAGKTFSGGFGKVIGGIGKVAIGAVAAGATAVGGIVASAVKSYGDYEQLAGGIETLFGDSAQTVIENADRAFQTAGMSANQYMETSIQSAAALINSLGGDTKEASKLMDMSITDMSDNVNKMGTSMEAVQNAYRGFARGNFLMLDNLALGFNGSKEGMQQLLDKAQEISGVKYDINSYSDIVKAIHEVQKEMEISGISAEEAAQLVASGAMTEEEAFKLMGTTAKEASTTIQGSLGSMKAAWENTLTAIANGEDWDMGVYIENLTESMKTFASNVLPVVQQSLVGVSSLIESLAPEIAAAIPGLITQILPGLLTAGVNIVQTLAQGILQALPQLMPAVTQTIMQLVQMLVGMLPQLIQIGAEIISQLITGIAQALPQLLPQIAQIIPQIVQTLIDNIPLLLSAGIELIKGLADGLIQALPILIEALPQLVQSLVDALVTNLPMIIDACIQLTNGIVTALPTIITALLAALPTIMEAVTQGLITATPQLVEGCVQVVAAIVAALPQIIAALVAAMPQILSTMAQAVVTGAPVFIQSVISLVTQIQSIVVSQGIQLVSQAGQILSQLLQTVVTWLSQLPTKAAYFAGQMAAQFINAIRALPSNLQKIWSQILSAVKSFGEKFISEGPKMAKDFINKLISAFGDAKSKMAEVGGKIVEGLKEGIKKSWTAMTDWIKELAASLIKGFKENLKIKSPSRVFADEIGQFIPMGIAEGIRKGQKFLNTEIDNMSADLVATSNQVITSDMSAMRYANEPTVSHDDVIYDLLSQWLPAIAAGKEVRITLDTTADRLFRLMQSEQRKNTQLTGAGA